MENTPILVLAVLFVVIIFVPVIFNIRIYMSIGREYLQKRRKK